MHTHTHAQKLQIQPHQQNTFFCDSKGDNLTAHFTLSSLKQPERNPTGSGSSPARSQSPSNTPTYLEEEQGEEVEEDAAGEETEAEAHECAILRYKNPFSEGLPRLVSYPSDNEGAAAAQ